MVTITRRAEHLAADQDLPVGKAANEIAAALVEVEFHGARIAMARRTVTRDAVVRRREVSPEILAALPADMVPVLRRVYAARKVRPAELSAGLSQHAARRHPGRRGAGRGMAGRCAPSPVRHRRRRRFRCRRRHGDGAHRQRAAWHGLQRRVLPRAESLRVRATGCRPRSRNSPPRRKPDILITVDNGISSVGGRRPGPAARHGGADHRSPPARHGAAGRARHRQSESSRRDFREQVALWRRAWPST